MSLDAVFILTVSACIGAWVLLYVWVRSLTEPEGEADDDEPRDPDPPRKPLPPPSCDGHRAVRLEDVTVTICDHVVIP